MRAVRPAAVAGLFYPRDPAALRQVLSQHLAPPPSVATHAPAGDPRARPKLLVVPHAGYVYSGGVAGHAFVRLRPWHAEIRRVVLLGPTHRVAVRGLAVPAVQAFSTPLGPVPLDTAALKALADLPQVVVSDGVHADEHALEVQLPFLQAVLDPGWTLVPLAVGDARPDEVAEVLERLWGGPETLIVVSTDLSHYLPYAQGRQQDRHTLQRWIDGATDLRGEEACGAHALNGVRRVLAAHGMDLQLLDLRSSGDTAGDRDRVVGYAALWAAETAADAGTAPSTTGTPGATQHTAHDAPLDPAASRALLASARAAIVTALGRPAPEHPAHPVLDEHLGCFVTLHDGQGRLRGCVGRLEPLGPLRDELPRLARAAAFDDTRFAPLQAAEWPSMTVEVSLLTPPQPWPVASLAEAERAWRPGRDGVTVAWRHHQATLLPQVGHDLPDPHAFLAALWRKAGLAAGFWAPDLRLFRYHARCVSGPAQP